MKQQSPEIAAVLKDADVALRFMREPIVQIAMVIPKLAGGLQDALDVEPFVVGQGQRAFLVIEVMPAMPSDYGHESFVDYNAGEKKGEREGGPWTFVQKLVPGTVVRVDEDLVSDLVEAQADRVRALRDDEAGTPQLPSISDPPTPEELAAAREATSPGEDLSTRFDDVDPPPFDGGDEADFLADAAADGAPVETDEGETE